MPVELKVPPVGESITEVQIGEWRKREGESIEKDENLVEIETDKATVELPAPISGTVTKLLKKRGETAAVGEVIAYMEEVGAAKAGAAAQPAPAAGKPAPGNATSTAGNSTPSAKPAPAAGTPAPAAAKPAPTANSVSSHAPSSQKPSSQAAPYLSADSPIDKEAAAAAKAQAASLIETSARNKDHLNRGHDGGRRKPDGAGSPLATRPSQALVASTPEMVSMPMAGKSRGAREEEVVPMTAIRRRIAQRLVEAQQTAALLTTFNEVDMSAVMALRNEHKQTFQDRYGVKLGFMSFFIKAAIDALKLVPQVNAYIRGSDIVYHNYYDIGVAVGGGKGLVVPIIRDADRMSFAEIELAIAELATRARENRLQLEELQGGTFTISNGGVYGSLLSTPIVNPPQSGILGLHSIQDRVVPRNGQIVIRPIMNLALTYDHRIVDGQGAVTFLKRIKDVIEEPMRMLVEV